MGKQKRGLLILVFVILALTLMIRATITLAFGVSSPFVVVEGTSMLPTLYNGDIVVIYKPPPDKIKVGDIIVYRSLKGNLVIHRVVEIVKSPSCKPVCFITRGDNNYHTDNVIGLEPMQGVSYSDIIGVVLSIHIKYNGKVYAAPLRIPYLGLITLYIRG